MSLFVNTNVSALNAQRQLINSGNGLSQAFQRLSSGFRINSAADDAAGLQISNRLTGQVNGLNQGISNANDGISLVQVAEGALEEISTSLQRMRVLAVQAENGINSPADRAALQKEVNALNKEIDRIASTTQFGGQYLLNGDFSTKFLVGANAGEENKIPVNLEFSGGFGADGLWVSQIDLSGSKSQESGTLPTAGEVIVGSPGLFLTNHVGGAEGYVMPSFKISVNGRDFVTTPDYFISPTLTREEYTQLFVDKIHEATQDNFLTSDASGDIFFTKTRTIQFAVNKVSSTPAEAADAELRAANLTGLGFNRVGTQAVGPLDFNTSILDDAIAKIDATRADLGAIQNRFQSAIRNLANVTENVSAARSRIRDADFAKETAELTRWQILQQAGTTILSQANQRPQAALNLLG
jgi:flagellin